LVKAVERAGGRPGGREKEVLETARQIGTALVKRQLAACVNLLPGVESIYRWQGQVERAAEVMAVFKTTRAAYPALAEALAALHPYKVPEIVACRPEAVAESYAVWVAAAVNHRDS
jgi:periplasmic divalent cation tolerance protein